MKQRVVRFFASGTIGAEDGKRTLEEMIVQANESGWQVEQIVPLSFRPAVATGGMEMVSGVLLCSKE